MINYRSYFFFFIPQIIILSAMLLLQNANAADKKNIVVTIKPLEGLVLAIAKDTVTVQRLLPDYTSLHDYHFRPSDIRKIKAADIIFRIDEDMERFLSPLLESLEYVNVISLADNPKIKQLAIISKGGEHAHHKEHANKEHHHGGHHHGNQDLHIWMSPSNGIIMAERITLALSKLTPEHSQSYQRNLSIFTEKINHFITRFQREAKPLQKKPYLVFHDSWHHFSHTFQLNKLASINLHADIQPGVKTILQTRKQIKQLHTSCLFTEPFFRPKTIRTLVEGLTIKTVELDVLGSHLKTTPDLYLNLLRYTATQIRHCLS